MLGIVMIPRTGFMGDDCRTPPRVSAHPRGATKARPGVAVARTGRLSFSEGTGNGIVVRHAERRSRGHGGRGDFQGTGCSPSHDRLASVPRKSFTMPRHEH